MGGAHWGARDCERKAPTGPHIPKVGPSLAEQGAGAKMLAVQLGSKEAFYGRLLKFRVKLS
ncbi:uncharacterized protein N7500_008754 [Penicillium coprophilum]|uniref:uncharacterized protein n=1 Tax=Penicillium coprophilum TaxID=36646 RepID=UPI00238E161B|nr:uncharacterized protein N7500_008754 [Penicillium coprophilum]KAJ5159103.1 hypothetical protein N7500_008754 [Penicillium coprophilum]